jgi:hypothetical protein
MKKNSKTICFRNILACCLIFAIFIASSTAVWALPENKPATGELIVSGNNMGGNAPFAMMNGEHAFTGRTFFSSSTIATTEDTNAMMRLGKLGSINLAPNSILSLSFGDNKISGNLIAGQVKVFSSEGVEVKIQTATQAVVNDTSQNNVFTVDVQTGTTNATAEIGAVRLDNGEAVVPANAPQQTNDTNGNSSYVIPLAVFAGIVATAFIYAATNGGDNNTGTIVTSPTR